MFLHHLGDFDFGFKEHHITSVHMSSKLRGERKHNTKPFRKKSFFTKTFVRSAEIVYHRRKALSEEKRDAWCQIGGGPFGLIVARAAPCRGLLPARSFPPLREAIRRFLRATSTEQIGSRIITRCRGRSEESSINLLLPLLCAVSVGEPPRSQPSSAGGTRSSISSHRMCVFSSTVFLRVDLSWHSALCKALIVSVGRTHVIPHHHKSLLLGVPVQV